MKKNAFYAQSGGVTAVINSSAAGVIETARSYPNKIGKVYAGKNGILGALMEDLIDTSKESADSIRKLTHTPSGAFGSCRYKMKSIENNPKEYERLIEVLAAHDTGYFFYNGGGDSADTCLQICKFAHKLNYPIQAIHIPKTIDNDLLITDNSPGFGSVAKYIAISTRETSFDVASMAKTSTKVFILEVMGRHTGWIASAGAMASDENTKIPVIILFPEVPFSKHNFLLLIKRKVEKYGYVSVVVAEGIKDNKGQFIFDQNQIDAFGNTQLGGVAPIVADIVKRNLAYKCHWAVADYMQRSARHIASKIDVEQAYKLGKSAVNLAIKGIGSIMLTIVRTNHDPYCWEIGSTKLCNVVNGEKKVPAHFITEDGFGITDKCREYLAPLMRGENYPPYRNNLPDYVRLKNILVKKKLKRDYRIQF